MSARTSQALSTAPKSGPKRGIWAVRAPQDTAARSSPYVEAVVTQVAEEALREKAAMGALSLAQVVQYASIALTYSTECVKARDFNEAARHAKFAADLLNTRRGAK